MLAFSYRHASHHHHHAPPGDRPRLPAAQTPGPGTDVRPDLRQGPRLLPGGERRTLHGGAAAGRGPGGGGPRLRQRGLGAKRSLALREFALGVEGLDVSPVGSPSRVRRWPPDRQSLRADRRTSPGSRPVHEDRRLPANPERARSGRPVEADVSRRSRPRPAWPCPLEPSRHRVRVGLIPASPRPILAFRFQNGRNHDGFNHDQEPAPEAP